MSNQNLRSVRVDFGANRLVIERNGTSTSDVNPFCAKSKNQQFLTDLCTKVGADPQDIFRGSVNHMVFLTEDQAMAMAGATVTDIAPFKQQQSGSRHDHQITVDDGIMASGGGQPPSDLDDVDEDDEEDSSDVEASSEDSTEKLTDEQACNYLRSL